MKKFKNYLKRTRHHLHAIVGITAGSMLNTKMDIYTFSEKEDMINFLERNGGEYINQELNK